ncbi:hypothetical protein [Piscibacillus salipiscarius]|uniref:HK97 gp10 family phage protein n=1 Tax=Piscibacillus salipiscarius TaxID=299480 RepID=A0ABW5Q8T6_9BACI|nr:hypothetical protein [Piscibacillus salipiscarius]
MSTSYNLDYSDIQALEEKLARLPGQMEQVMNDVLHRQGIEITARHITERMPVSDRNKRHAKYSKWWKSERHNLGFTIKAKGGAANKPRSFGYLVFPNEGRGPHNPMEQRFMEEGLAESVNPILNELNEAIDQKLKEELS